MIVIRFFCLVVFVSTISICCSCGGRGSRSSSNSMGIMIMVTVLSHLCANGGWRKSFTTTT